MADGGERGPREILEAYMLAYNSHDAEAIRALYAEDATVDMPGFLSIGGEEEILALMDYDLALNIQLLITGMREVEDTVTCTLTEMNDWLRAAGIGEARYSATFRFEGGRVKSIRAEAQPESARSILSVLEAFAGWAGEERPEEFRELIPEGKFDYNRDTAEKFVALLKEWREATRTPETGP
jgi:limonene-1,2-epoxide hydrolase